MAEEVVETKFRSVL